jgi:hypothetical protein
MPARKPLRIVYQDSALNRSPDSPAFCLDRASVLIASLNEFRK